MNFKKFPRSPRTPDGYRLATAEEFKNNLAILKNRRVLSGSEMVRVLDAVFDGKRELEIPYSDESVFSASFMLVFGQDPPAVLRSSRLVRTDLYYGVSLDDQRRRDALYWSCIFRDIEAICCLQNTASRQSQLTDLINSSKISEDNLYDTRFWSIVSMLSSQNSDAEKDMVNSLSYALKCEGSADYTVAVAEKVCDVCIEQRKTEFLSSKIEEIARLSVDTRIPEWEAKHIGILTKLLYKLLEFSSPGIRDYRSRDEPTTSADAMRFPLGSRGPTVSLQIIKDRFEKLLREACLRAYVSLVKELLSLLGTDEGCKLVGVSDKEDKTLLHYAAEWKSEEKDTDEVCRSLFEAYKRSIGFGAEYVTEVDKRGASVLHCASFSGRREFCKILKDEYGLNVDNLDSQGENIWHYAAKGEYGSFNFSSVKDPFHYLGCAEKKGRTPLHLASLYNNQTFVSELTLSRGIAKLKSALKIKDYAGQTPLHLAAHAGHVDMVSRLLSVGSDPLAERDISGKTALHHAVTNSTNSKDVTLKLVTTLIEHYEKKEEEKAKKGKKEEKEKEEKMEEEEKAKKEKAIFLWTSALDIGTADEVEGLDPDVQKLLLDKKNQTREVNVLGEAVSRRDLRLTWEILNRGGDAAQLLKNPKFQWVMKEVEKFSEQGRNQPTLEDTLGRDVLAEGIAGHFLNPYIKSPITVSICGGSGMGKTSLMKQIEAHLLITAAQLAFPYLWQFEDFNGVRNITLSKHGGRICKKIEKGITKLSAKGNDVQYKNAMKCLLEHNRDLPQTPPHITIRDLPQRQIDTGSLIYFLEKYRPAYREVYKSLACMDVNQLLKSDEEEWVYNSQGQSLGALPRVLTVYFKAGNYSKGQEVWAGLAVEITKEIEASMTLAQRFSTRCRNAWRRYRWELIFKYILPGLVLAFIVPLLGLILWRLLDNTSVKKLWVVKYGSLALTAIISFWSIVTYIFPAFSSVSTQIGGFLSDSDHSKQAGYQHTVISDIKFLKGEIGKPPYRCFSIFCWEKFVGDTPVPKYGSAPEGKLRVIAFVDDIEQCEDDAILQVFWAINMVLRECEINVILAMDKDAIEKALKKAFENQDKDFVHSFITKTTQSPADKDFVDTFITKSVQLPVNLPEPADDEWEGFLQSELRHEPNLTEFTVKDAQAETEEAYHYPFCIVPSNCRDDGQLNPPSKQNECQQDPVSASADGQLRREPVNQDIRSGRRTRWKECLLPCINWHKDDVQQESRHEGQLNPPSQQNDRQPDPESAPDDVQPRRDSVNQDIQSGREGSLRSCVNWLKGLNQDIQSGCERCLLSCINRLKGIFVNQDILSGCEGCLPSCINWLKGIFVNQEILSGYEGCLPSCINWLRADEPDLPLTSKPLLNRARQMRDTLLLSYIEEEVETFHKLRKFATGIQKRPREWKCYLNYHKFAKNVIFKKANKTNEEPDFPAAWQVEFVVWTFVCWQWKRQMNLLIQDWYKFYDVKENGKTKLKPSLKTIVENYIEQGLPSEQEEEQKDERNLLKEVLKVLNTVHGWHSVIPTVQIPLRLQVSCSPSRRGCHFHPAQQL